MTTKPHFAMAPEPPLALVPATDKPADPLSLLARPAYGQQAALRVAVIGTYAPRNCGIATFTADLCEQLGTHFPDVGIEIYALEAEGSRLAYADGISVIAAQEAESYAKAARAINRSGVDVVWIQHEFGIFGA